MGGPAAVPALLSSPDPLSILHRADSSSPSVAASSSHALPEFDAILFCDEWGFETIRNSGLWWRSPRISWDEISNIEVYGTIRRRARKFLIQLGTRCVKLRFGHGPCGDNIVKDFGCDVEALPIAQRVKLIWEKEQDPGSGASANISNTIARGSQSAGYGSGQGRRR
jgi:hypothetical protein